MQKSPWMIYGTAWKKEDTYRCVQEALAAGFRAFDTACQPRHYYEWEVGRALEDAIKENKLTLDELFIQTKFTPEGGQDPHTIPYNPHESIEKQILASFEVSKKQLRTSFINSYILHSPIYPFATLLKAWQTLETLVQKKEVAQIGISNCYDLALFEQLFDYAKIKPKVLQNRFYNQSGYDKQLREFCLSHDIAYQSFWSLSANPHLVHSHYVSSLATKYSKTNEQIFYRFLIHIGITPLNGTTSKIHMQEDFDVMRFELEKDEIALLIQLLGV